MRDILRKLVNKTDLTFTETREAMHNLLQTDVTDTEIAAFLTALKIKGETADEIAGIAEVVRGQSELSTISLPNVMDNCGTGGDNSNSFNISTTTSFVLAGAGITVAKHGNRSVSGSTGSADVLEQLGVSLTLKKEQLKEILTMNKIAFLFAPHIHVNLRPFMKVRNELGIPTIFNLIGPLTNPIELDTQLIGVYDRSKLMTIATTLKKIGRKRAVVLNGAGQMDEASLAGNNELVLLNDGKITNITLHPKDVGLNTCGNEAIVGGNARENANILLRVLNNEPGPYLDTVLLNSAIAFFANGMANTIADGVDIARESIASGAALERLNKLIDYSKMTEEAI